ADLGRHRRRLQAQAVVTDRPRGLVHDTVLRRPAVLEREVEAGERDLDPDHVRREDPERLLEQLLARLVAFQDDDRLEPHRRRRLATPSRGDPRGAMPQRIGWRREGSKGRFRYIDADGRRITDEDTLERIRALAIPPAWKDVWISPSPRRKLQATGVDAAGRKQYLYHPAYRARQEEAKYDRL